VKPMADLDHIRWIRRPELRRPFMVAAFTGWNDAADAASMAVRQLIEYAGAAPLAEVDPEEFTDFATVRPHVRLDDDSQRHIVWPTVGLWTLTVDSIDLILVLGPEPALSWKTFCRQLVGVAQTYNAAGIISLGALLADVPHRRDTQVIGTSTDEHFLDSFDLQRSRYEGPTGILGVLNDMASRSGLVSAALWAAVPAYAAQVPSPKAASALLQRLSDIIGAHLPVLALEERTEEYEYQIDALISQDASLAKYLERLENMDDEDYEDDDDDEMVDSSNVSMSEDLVDSDSLMEEVERFLRSQHDD
jgi:proteasome assembly chaperone (PAC2) family protein